jgi:protein-disulfide isomerase
VWRTVFPKHEAAAPEPETQVGPHQAIAEPATPMRIAQASKPQSVPKSAVAPPAAANFKEQGSPTATVTIEIYTDYECPSCAMLYRDFVPTLLAEYVRTGKVKLLHRDFPLPQHPYAKVAARYANAAGRLGYYDAAVEQIFKTQDKWSGAGDVDAQLVPVLPPGVMQKIREMVRNDNTLDATVEADMAMVRTDQVNQTPTLVVVSKGKRQPIAGAPQWSLFRSYLDKLLEP